MASEQHLHGFTYAIQNGVNAKDLICLATRAQTSFGYMIAFFFSILFIVNRPKICPWRAPFSLFGKQSQRFFHQRPLNTKLKLFHG
jgi:hypothetical protein